MEFVENDGKKRKGPGKSRAGRARVETPKKGTRALQPHTRIFPRSNAVTPRLCREAEGFAEPPKSGIMDIHTHELRGFIRVGYLRG